jgi:hypothetical protein
MPTKNSIYCSTKSQVEDLTHSLKRATSKQKRGIPIYCRRYVRVRGAARPKLGAVQWQTNQDQDLRALASRISLSNRKKATPVSNRAIPATRAVPVIRAFPASPAIPTRAGISLRNPVAAATDRLGRSTLMPSPGTQHRSSLESPQRFARSQRGADLCNSQIVFSIPQGTNPLSNSDPTLLKTHLSQS